MAKNEKRISISMVDKIMKEHFDNAVTDKWNDVDVNIKRSISFTEMLEFVNDVVMSCFQDDGGYMPEVMDFAIKSNILTKYANFSMPDNLEHRYEIIYKTDAVDFVCQRINMNQLQEIVASINRKTGYICDGNVKMIEKQMNDLIAALEGMQTKATDMFANVSPEDVAKMVGAFGSGNINEDKIVEAYLKQMAPSTNSTGEPT